MTHSKELSEEQVIKETKEYFGEPPKDNRRACFAFEYALKKGFELGLEAEQEWLPIEAAPKDGSSFLAYENGYGIMETYWCNNHDDGNGGFRNAHHGWSPTHWQPLPQPPQTGEG